MADYCCNAYMRELDVDVHRWLPSEILSDIGVVVDTAERRGLAVVEDLAARLASVLGGTVERTHHHVVCPSSMAAADSLPRRHIAPAEAWPFSSKNDGMMTLGVAVPVPSFAPARQLPPLAHVGHAILPPARPSGGGGTKVFLPRTVAYNGTTSSRTTGGNVNGTGTKPPPPPRHSKQQQQQSRPRRQHQSGEENESARRSRRQLHGLHAHTVSAGAGRPEQTPRRVVGANPTPRLCPGIALPLPAGMGLLTRPNRDARMMRPVISLV